MTARHPTGPGCGCVLLGKGESEPAQRGLWGADMLYIPVEKHAKCLIFLGCAAAVQILVCIDPAVVPFTLVCSFKRGSLLILYPHRLLFQAVLLMQTLRVSRDCLSCWKLPSAAFLLTPGCVAVAFFQCAFRTYRCESHSLFRLVLQRLCVGVAGAG